MRRLLLRPSLLEFCRAHLLLTALGDVAALVIGVLSALTGTGKGILESLPAQGAGPSGSGLLITAAMALCLLAYLPAGRLSRQKGGWPRPDVADAVVLLLLPALAFWLLLAIPMALLHNVGFQIAAILLNAPAYGLFVFLAGLLDLQGALWGWLGYVGAMAAGLLPPLLFLTGSYLPIRDLDGAEESIEEYIEKQ
ncbi:MAG TPA: hypothetical protein H9719_09410 [Candidatus Intestinimonas stercoravium]|uniref:hypothetical protein n=1 Tax=uncultured Intestinimonas sp. TaxID=1689265 RepID=UPI001F8BC454|nr:hypothetical protein [uncultured Intestinimonas sp.]HJA64334.1 hypothetical protein [Candidatus Intestinimonas stercoravium]